MDERRPAAVWQDVQACQTLMQVHEALARLRPPKGADAARWVTYRRRSAAAYEQIADIDRGHHHEALYWAQRERTQANEIARHGVPKPGGSGAGQS
ncbi:MAG TPA: AMED_5909 family protein [Actinophytocola sp.]|uniref:AMED_5909 family protein n=1 Tax=Actinophytocola sp. TaxID=1872138 RepID=UPI002DB6DA1C|nr:AMED_5909 family protein [Actinophytocola sp.]HEU5476136.1 AMED_5909 family protein [Actinophytocola sp.]